jgi:hypothetical protein
VHVCARLAIHHVIKRLSGRTRLKNFPTRLALRIAGVSLAALLLFAGVFIWRAMNGPVSLGMLTPRLEAMINSGLKGMQLHFDDSILAWSEGRKLAHIQFIGVSVVDSNEAVIARVPRANITLSGPALLSGSVAPTNVELIGVSANVVRRAGGGFQLGLQVNPAAKVAAEKSGDGNSQAMIEAVLKAMLRPTPDDNLSRYLKRFAISEAKLSVFDEDTRSYWSADKASLVFDRKPDGVVLSVSAPVKLGKGATWKFRASGRYTNGSDDIALEASFDPVRLRMLAENGTGLQALRGVDIPVQGNAACSMKISGTLGRCQLWLNAGTGELKLPALKKEPIHLREAALTVQMDFAQGRYAIEELTWQGNTIRGEISGDGAFQFSGDGDIRKLTADWTARNISIDVPNLFDGGLALEMAKFKGAYDASTKSLTIEQILARKGPFELNLSGAMQDNPVSTGVTLVGSAKDLSIADLKKLWPAGAVVGARDWIFENIHEGVIKSADIAVNIAPGALVDDRIPDEMMNIGLQMTGLRVTYLSGLPDMTKVNGSATLRGDTFMATIDTATVGSIVMSKGNVLLNELHKTGAIGNVSGTMAGPTRDVLLLLDQPRLHYPSRYGIQAAKAGGNSKIDFAFAIPMLRDLNASDIGIDVNAELSAVTMPVTPKIGITGGKFSIKLSTQALKALGAVQLNGANVGFIWNEDFTGTAKYGTHIDVTATLSETQRDIFGLNAGPFLEGKTAIVATFTGGHGKIQNATIDANLTGSRLSIPQLNWAKPEDATANVKAGVAFRPDGSIEVSNIDATGRDIKAQGRLIVSGSTVTAAEFKRIELGKRNDFAVSMSTALDRTRAIEIKGKALDAAGLFDSAGDADTPAEPAKSLVQPMVIKADVGSLALQAGVTFTNVRFLYADDGVHLTQFNLDAVDQASHVKGELTTAADGGRKLKFEAVDAGRVVKGLTGFRSLIGGNLKLYADLTPLNDGVKSDAAFDARLVVDDFKIVDQPFFARLLSAGSFTGLDDLMRGEGITFSRLEQNIHGRGGMLTFSDGRAAGPAIGLTMQGTWARGVGKLDLNGTIVPLYGLNSIFEGIPLVSDLLGSKDGEGIFAVTYGVRGQLDELKVAVNPVSMLTPGFLRKIFQVGAKPEPAAPMPLPMPRPEQKSSLLPGAKLN